MRPPGNYDALRQAEQQAREAREAASEPDASAQLDSARDEPTRPPGHAATRARYTDRGEPVLPVETRFDAAEIARAAKERADAAKVNEQDKGKDGSGR